MPKYKIPKIHDDDMSKSKVYTLKNGERFWFDSNYYRVMTDDPDKYVQFIWRVYLGVPNHRFILGMEGHEIQFAAENGDQLPMMPPKNEDGLSVWRFGSIGYPVRYHTLEDDIRLGIKRPMRERHIVIAQDSKFASLEQQERGIAFFKAVVSKYTASWNGMMHGKESSAIVEFTDELTKQIERGDFVE